MVRKRMLTGCMCGYDFLCAMSVAALVGGGSLVHHCFSFRSARSLHAQDQFSIPRGFASSKPMLLAGIPRCGTGPLRRFRVQPVSSVARRVSADEDPWAILGVPPGSSKTEVKRAYRKRALKEHPDVNKAPDAKKRWQELSKAYDILSDPEKRRKWEESRAQQTRRSAGRSEEQKWRGADANYGRRYSQSGQGAAEAGRRASEASRRAAQEAGRVGQDVAARAAAAAAAAASAAAAAAASAARSGKAAATAGKVGQAVAAGAAAAASAAAAAAGRVASAVGPDFSSQRRRGWPEAGAEELREAERELKKLQNLVSELQEEEDVWARVAQEKQSSGDKRGELEALRRALRAREDSKAAREKLFRCYEKVEYWRSVAFKAEG